MSRASFASVLFLLHKNRLPTEGEERVFNALLIASAAVMSGGVTSYGMPWLLVPLVALPGRFGTRGLAAGVGFTALLVSLAVTNWVLIARRAARGTADPALGRALDAVPDEHHPEPMLVR